MLQKKPGVDATLGAKMEKLQTGFHFFENL